MDRGRLLKLTSAAACAVALPAAARPQPNGQGGGPGLWGVWDSAFARARFVSLSHVLAPYTPVWKGFPPTTKFEPGTGRLDDKSEAPLPYNAQRLAWNPAKGVRERSAACDKPNGKQSFN